MVPMDLSDLIDFERFPIDQPNSCTLSDVIKTVADALDDDGCAVLRGFVKQEAVKALVEEADAVLQRSNAIGIRAAVSKKVEEYFISVANVHWLHLQTCAATLNMLR